MKPQDWELFILRFRVYRVRGLWFRVWGLEGLEGLESRGFRVQGLGFRAWGLGFRV